jgi:hypothetical protein
MASTEVPTAEGWNKFVEVLPRGGTHRENQKHSGRVLPRLPSAINSWLRLREALTEATTIEKDSKPWVRNSPSNSYEDSPVKKTKFHPALTKRTTRKSAIKKGRLSVSLPAFGFAFGMAERGLLQTVIEALPAPHHDPMGSDCQLEPSWRH